MAQGYADLKLLTVHQSLQPESSQRLPDQNRFLWRVSVPVVGGLAKAFFSLKVEWQGDLPDPPYVVASNHYSHFDPPVIGAALKVPMRFLALEDLFGVNAILDRLIRGYGVIPTPRYRRPIAAIRTAIAALETGENVGVFPEATRVSHWGTLPPKRGAAWLAQQANVPLVPVAVIGTGKAMDLDNKIRRAPVQVVVGQALPPTGDSVGVTRQWANWMTCQIGRFPGSEVGGPQRAFQDGPGGPTQV